MLVPAFCGFLIGLICALPLGLWALRHRDDNLDRAEVLCLLVMVVLAIAFGYAVVSSGQVGMEIPQVP